jgi:hypothetical protein
VQRGLTRSTSRTATPTWAIRQTPAFIFFFSLCCPVVSFLSLFMLHERSNFGLGACLSAMDLLVQGCFYTAVKESMTGSVALTGLLPFLIFIALFAMGLEIYGYLLAGPSQSPKGGK